MRTSLTRSRDSARNKNGQTGGAKTAAATAVADQALHDLLDDMERLAKQRKPAISP